MKKILPIILIVLFFAGIYFFVSYNDKKETVINDDDTNNVVAVNPIQLCFYKSTKTNSNFNDVSWLRLNLSGEKVTGEFNYLPAEKDKKTGTFEGVVGAVDKMAMARTADVWWSSMAEGMQNKEQLRIVFGEGNAQAGFGEMVDRGDGIYVYKDISKLSYGENMSDVGCDELNTLIKK